MKNLLLSLIFFIVVGYACKVAYDKFTYGGDNILKKTYSYPAKITIKNKEGLEIQITLLGRSSSYLKFKKKKGSQGYVYPISSLSEKSKVLILKYPDTGLGDISSYLSSGNMKLEDVYVVHLEEEIRRMEAEISRLALQASATQSKSEVRTIQRKIEMLEKEIAEIRHKLADRQKGSG